MVGFLLGAGLGAALTYFLDPDQGARRRNIARDRLIAVARRTGEQVGRQADYAASTAQGIYQKAAHQDDNWQAQPDDMTLARKVETELFRDPNVPKGKINVNAEDGLVVLRGEVERPEEIDSLEDKVRNIPGVLEVQNLLHLPGTPAPTVPS